MIRERSPLARLRTTLEAFERSFGALSEGPAAARQTLALSDALEDHVRDARAAGAEIGAEEVQILNLRDQIRLQAPQIAAQIGTPDAELRGGVSWAIVAAAIATRRRDRNRALFTIGVPVALVAGLVLAIILWPQPPRPDINTIQALVYANDLPGALALARSEAAQFPADYEAASWYAAVTEASGRDASELWQQAAALTNDEIQFLFQRATLLLDIGQIDAAEELARQLTGTPAGVIFGELLQGDVESTRYRVPEAVAAFERAAAAAKAADQPELEALARLRIALQLQRPPGSTATPTR